MRYLFFGLGMLLLSSACRQQPERPAAEPTVAPTPANTTANSPAEKRYVHAASGVVLRKTPSKDGEKIATLPYSDRPVEVLETASAAGRYVAEQFEGGRIEGDWLRVRTADGQEGYVFGGYLSRHVPVIESSEEGVEDLDWLYRTYSPLRGPREKSRQAEAPEGYSQNYADGARFDVAYFPGGVTYLLELPSGSMTHQEAFVVLRSFCLHGEGITKSSFDPKNNAYVATFEDGGYIELFVQAKPDGSILARVSYPD
jgi:hypothetical protein